MPRILPGETDVYALTDSRLALGRSVEEQARALLSAGVKILQYREKHAHAGVMLEECRLLRRLTLEAGACFIVNDHVDIAMLVDADGVHVGQDDLPVPEVRRLLGPDKIIGLSTHSPEQARAAVAAGADYIGVGPIFATQTKEDVCSPVGFSYLEWVVANIRLPFVAIGGIKEHNIAEVTRRGAKCCALVSELVGAPDIEEKVRAVRAARRRGCESWQKPASAESGIVAARVRPGPRRASFLPKAASSGSLLIVSPACGLRQTGKASHLGRPLLPLLARALRCVLSAELPRALRFFLRASPQSSFLVAATSVAAFPARVFAMPRGQSTGGGQDFSPRSAVKENAPQSRRAPRSDAKEHYPSSISTVITGMMRGSFHSGYFASRMGKSADSSVTPSGASPGARK